MKTQILLTFAIFLLPFALQAQEKRCGFTHKPNLQQEQLIKELINQKAQSNSRIEEKTYTIPVLFHIIQTNNLNDDVNKLTSIQIKEQIKILNNDYNRLNADTVRTPEIFKNVTGKISINFVLAKIDSNGVVLKEEGIVRHTKFGKIEWQLADFETEVKPQTIRNPYKYLNIWVVNELKDSSDRLLGYAQFPDFSGLQGIAQENGTNKTDGVLITSRTLVSLGQTNPIEYRYGYGRTLTHELGHFLGVLHTFSDARGLCTDNDFCDDTPRLSNPTEEKTSCNPKNEYKCEFIAMPENFLDYTNDACMNLFTKCQVERMKVVLEKCPRRKELANSTVTSAREENLAERISIFPNPAHAFFTIKTENLPIKNLKLYSVLGQQVYQNTDIQANTSIDIAHLPKAMYVLQIETEQGMAIKKLVVE